MIPPIHDDLLLAIDVGNSRYKFGLFTRPHAGSATPHGAPDAGSPDADPDQAESSGRLPVCLAAWTVPTSEPLPWGDLVAWASSGDANCTAAIIAGANPAGVDRLHAGWPATWPQSVVVRGPELLPLRVNLPAPEKVGIDRLLNAVAANALRKAGQAAIIVDTGTATTVDFVSPSGDFEGGAILPGFQLCAASLHEYTALLPLIDMPELAGRPPAALGRSTRDALRSGLFWGQLGAVKELIAQLAAQTPEAPLLILTGGGAAILSPHLPPHADPGPYLPLQGLALVAAWGQHDAAGTGGGK